MSMMLNRRNFLQGAGVTIGLPFMASQALGQSNAARAGGQKSMVFVTTGLGMYPGAFFPKDYGLSFTASQSLAPMMRHRGDFTVFSNMDHPNVHTGHGGLRSFLNGRGRGVGSIATVDQVAANVMGYQTRFPSMHMSTGGSSSHSYTASGTRVRMSGNAKAVFNQLFVQDSAAASKKLAQQIDEQGSVLDLVLGQVKTIMRSSTATDRDKLDEYVTAIRDSEVKLQGQQRWLKVPKPSAQQYGFTVTKDTFDSDFHVQAPLIFDLIKLAIQSDSSRVFTVSFGMHNHRIGLDGVTTGYHSLSHHGRRPDKLKQLGIIETYYVSQVARFMDGLKEVGSASGSLLDDTSILFGSALSDAARHSNRKLPIMLAGGGYKHKGHVDVQQHNGKSMPLSNLYTSMLQGFGMEVEKYNTATGDLNHILTSV